MPEDVKKPTIPAAPSHLPKALRKQWSDTYESSLKQSQADNSELPAEVHRRNALREANKLVRVEEPKSYAEAKKLVEAFQAKTADAWKIIAHGTRKIDGEDHLQIVTSNGKKHSYKIPANA